MLIFKYQSFKRWPPYLLRSLPFPIARQTSSLSIHFHQSRANDTRNATFYRQLSITTDVKRNHRLVTFTATKLFEKRLIISPLKISPLKNILSCRHTYFIMQHNISKVFSSGTHLRSVVLFSNIQIPLNPLQLHIPTYANKRIKIYLINLLKGVV